MFWSQLLFTQGFGTRRVCAGLIAAQAVIANGHVVDEDDEVDAVDGITFEVNGQPWQYQASALILLHKPAGYECSQKPRHHPSVLTLLPPPLRNRGVQTIGRLDEDTTGLLLLTDDGTLIHRLTSPKHHVPKVYEVTCKHAMESKHVLQLLRGVVLDDDPAPVRAAAAELISPTHLRLTLTEGKYHQVKRMVAAVGNRVETLHRSVFGGLTLDAVPEPRQWRWIGIAERSACLESLAHKNTRGDSA
jgi:16S rRNA pseudouridine516 synthase